MALTTKRIIALPSQTDPQEGDYLAIDNMQSGTHKIPVDRIGVEVDDTLTEAGKAADAKAVGDALDEIRSQIEVTGTASGAIATFTDGSDNPMKSCMVTIAPQQSGTGTPSPDNVRPISGWESVDVYDTGVNVWDEEWEQGDLNSQTGQEVSSTTYIRGKNYTPCRPNVEYYGKANSKIWLYWYDQDKNYISNTSGGFQNASRTAPSTAYFFRLVQMASAYDNGTSINYPASDTAYHPYDPDSRTTTVNLGRTVYGGTLDVVSGVLTVDRAYKKFTSSEPQSNVYSVTVGTNSTRVVLNEQGLPNAKVGSYLSFDSNAFKYAYSSTPNVGEGSVNNGYLLIGVPTTVTTKAELISYLAEIGAEFVYELATPQTYQLTPTEVKTLLGENNVWADSGDVEVVYIRDLNIAINNLLNSNGTRSLGMMAMSAPTESTTDEQTEEPAEDDMR